MTSMLRFITSRQRGSECTLERTQARTPINGKLLGVLWMYLLNLPFLCTCTFLWDSIPHIIFPSTQIQVIFLYFGEHTCWQALPFV